MEIKITTEKEALAAIAAVAEYLELRAMSDRPDMGLLNSMATETQRLTWKLCDALMDSTNTPDY